MSERQHILIVEDDDQVGKLLEMYLEGEGFDVFRAHDGEGMRRLMAEQPIDLVLMDLMLPGEDGLRLTRHLRENYTCGIIILTGKGSTVDRIIGLEVGADDYVAKPFDERELLARIRSVLSRLQGRGAAQGANSAGIGSSEGGGSEERACLYFSGWCLDMDARQLTDPQGQNVELTGSEYNLLVELASKAGRVLSRDHLMSSVHQRDWEPYDRSIDVLVTRLRRKLEGDTRHPTIIKTVRGAGYVFSARVQRQAPTPGSEPDALPSDADDETGA